MSSWAYLPWPYKELTQFMVFVCLVALPTEGIKDMIKHFAGSYKHD